MYCSKFNIATILFATAIIFTACKKDVPYSTYGIGATDQHGWVYKPIVVAIPTPTGFPSVSAPSDNPQTEAGIKLGRMLFYDPILSNDSTLACAGCHQQQYAFTNGPNNTFSKGITGQLGSRNAPPLFNLVYSSKYFWDGRAASLEEQVVMPVENPIEMASNWSTVIEKLQRSSRYPKLFFEAFGIESDSITKNIVAKALAQFLRTIVSGNSKFDKQLNGAFVLNNDELAGYSILTEGRYQLGGDCFHCHGDGSQNRTFMELAPENQFRNNGLQNAVSINDFVDAGRGKITHSYSDYGRFKIPSLRNLVFTAPYMHDGRFTSLEQVVDFYSTGVHNTPFTDPNMQFASQGGVNLDSTKKTQLVAFLKTLTDSTLITNPDYSNPFH